MKRYLQKDQHLFTKYTKKVVFLFFFIACLLLLTGVNCAGLYKGDYPELYSMAMNTLPGVTGITGPHRFAWVSLIDEDNYGRKLFSYKEAYGMRISTYSLHISQTSDEQYVYFYPYYSFISAPTDDFTNKEIGELKSQNDWNKEIKLTECVKVKITDRKGEGPLTDMQILPFYRSALKNDANENPYIDYFISDMYGRSIYLAYSKALTDNSGEDYRRAILMLFTPHCPYSNDWIELFDFFNYQEDLKQFMESNNWNQPYE